MTSSPLGEAAKYKKAIVDSIQAAKRAGYHEFYDILRQCEGADPVLVAELLKSMPAVEAAPTTGTRTYESLSAFFRQLPAPDPFRSQWWFSSSGISHLLSVVDFRASLFEAPRIFCLGVPTLSPYLSKRHYRIEVFDIDKQVLDAVTPPGSSFITCVYDASDDLPGELFKSFQLGVLDPPWYPEAIYTFLNRAISAVVDGGEILCTLPGRLTRPGIENFRAELIKDLVTSGHERLSHLWA